MKKTWSFEVWETENNDRKHERSGVTLKKYVSTYEENKKGNSNTDGRVISACAC